jgi:hypothetical protein
VTMFAYRCQQCGVLERDHPGDTTHCRCGRKAKRIWDVQVKASSFGDTARWDPVVGEYVRNDNEFRAALERGAERESKELNTEVVWKPVDSRDIEGVAELHGGPVDHWHAEAENTKRQVHDEQHKANNEERPATVFT